MPLGQKQKAEQFRAMHTGSEPLILPNTWDAASARVIESLGFRAVGTSSAGVAFSLGYADGENIPREEALFAIRRVCSTVSIPVTADIEAGYGANSVEEVLKTVRGVLEAGAIGINLEDRFGPGLTDSGLQSEKIQAIRELGNEVGVPIVINARTDAFALSGLDDSAKFKLSVERANGYREAGADSLFVPFILDRQVIAKLAQEISGPLNILAMPGVPPIPELIAMGVRRISMGGGLQRATMGLLRNIATELRNNLDFRPMTANQMSYDEMNDLFKRE